MAEDGDSCQLFSAIDFPVRRCPVVTGRRARCPIRRELHANVHDHANPRDSRTARRPETVQQNFSQLCEGGPTPKPRSREKKDRPGSRPAGPVVGFLYFSYFSDPRTLAMIRRGSSGAGRIDAGVFTWSGPTAFGCLLNIGISVVRIRVSPLCRIKCVMLDAGPAHHVRHAQHSRRVRAAQQFQLHLSDELPLAVKPRRELVQGPSKPLVLEVPSGQGLGGEPGLRVVEVAPPHRGDRVHQVVVWRGGQARVQ